MVVKILEIIVHFYLLGAFHVEDSAISLMRKIVRSFRSLGLLECRLIKFVYFAGWWNVTMSRTRRIDDEIVRRPVQA